MTLTILVIWNMTFTMCCDFLVVLHQLRGSSVQNRCIYASEFCHLYLCNTMPVFLLSGSLTQGNLSSSSPIQWQLLCQRSKGGSPVNKEAVISDTVHTHSHAPQSNKYKGVFLSERAFPKTNGEEEQQQQNYPFLSWGKISTFILHGKT